MTVTASAHTSIDAEPRTILEFVLDLDRYRAVDPKIVRVGSVRGPDAEGHGSARLWGRLPGLPPALDRQDFTLERWRKLTFVGAPRQPGRLVFDFVGTFECEPSGDGSTIVTHAYEFTFHGPFRLYERRLARSLQQELETEMTSLAAALGAER